MRASFLAAAARPGRPLGAAVLLLAASVAPAAAQSRSVTVQGTAQGAGQGAESSLEAEIDRLVRELLLKRRATVGLASNLQAMQGALRNGSVSAGQRAQVETSMRLMRTRLASFESDMAGIQRRLFEMCAPGGQPEGWVGIAYSGSASATREDDGRLIMRFIDYPSIESVEPGSPADKAGIRGGDRILSMSGKDLRGAEIDFTPLLKPGTRIPFKVRRGVEAKVLTVTVRPRPDDFTTPCPWVDERITAALAPMQMTVTVTTDEEPTAPSPPGATRVFVKRPAPPGVVRAVPAPAPTVALPAPPVAPLVSLAPLAPLAPQGSVSTVVFAGAQFVAVGAELSEALGVERGLLVVGAGRGSPAEQSGLRTGDVLVSVDGRSLTSPLVFLQAVEQADSREVRLQLLRRRKPMAVTLKW